MCLSFKESTTTSLQLNVYGVSDIRGNLMIAVYESKKEFPEFGKGDINIVHKVDTRTPKVLINNLIVGKRYAIAIFHDANGNKFLDKNFLGMPEEKYGFSNDARGTFGPPYFSEASFVVSKDLKVSISIR